MASVVAGLAAWVLLVWQAERVGIGLRHTSKLGAAPLAGKFRPILGAAPSAALVGVVLAGLLPAFCQRLRWRHMLAVVALAGLAWGVALASVRGSGSLDRSVRTKFEYPAVVPEVDRIGVGRFVRTFHDPEVLRHYPIHVQGHPVGAPLVFVALDRIGLGGPRNAGRFLMLAGAGIAPGVLLAVREVAGERRARQAAPFLVLGPSAIWLITSSDALFSLVGAWAVTLLVLASGSERPRASRITLAVAGGVLFGVGVHLSYGLVPLGAVPAVVLLARRAWSVPAWATLGVGAVVGAFVAAGFWLPDGLDATHIRYLAGVSTARPFHYFAYLANPAAFLICTGPVAVIAALGVRDRRLWLLAAGALVAVLMSDASGLSKGEVERIWLPFVPWVMVPAAGLFDAGRRARTDGVDDHPPRLVNALLVLQVAVAVAVESIVLTPW